ncbi:hypothetical protein N7478_010200 [Penicillium angulare]|uniref:uncharacterized protein n=1 Tax=Penicillium angulare TaxID=116970 RepID=UPI0025401023|nr:uncharacterized protein N7478_010200 [Penicillium angulare]KAJ5267392.1 hypothetical protein N7478_010200 [Penicillium angulare]
MEMESLQTLQSRKKAWRSCLNCQRSHKTCGDERPCPPCVKRGIPHDCVNGYRKPPKYLSESMINSPDLAKYKTVINLRKKKPRASRSSIVTGDKLASKTRAQDTETNKSTSESSSSSSEHSNFIDPRVLEVKAPPSELPKYQISSSSQNQSSHKSPHGSEDDTTDSESSLDIQIMTPQNFAFKSYEQAELAVLEYCESESIPGFTISSGWSETFFPYEHLGFEKGEQYQESANIVFGTCYRHEWGIYGQC